MSSVRTLLILSGIFLLISCGGKPTPDTEHRDPIAGRWLEQDCSVEADSLHVEVRRAGKSLGPMFLRAFEEGLPDSIAAAYIERLPTLYQELHRGFDDGDSLLLTSEKDRELFRSQSLEAFVEAEYGKREIEYRSRAALGLGLIRYRESLPIFEKVLKDDRYRPLHGVVRQAVKMIEESASIPER